MLLEFFPELIRWGGGTLNRTVAFNKKIPIEIFWVCLKLCRFFDFEFIEKISLDFSVELIREGLELSTELLDLKKKIPSKFFGYV